MSLLTYFEVPIPAAQLLGMGRLVGETGGAEAVWLRDPKTISEPIRIECGESVREKKNILKNNPASMFQILKLLIQNFEPAPPCHAN